MRALFALLLLLAVPVAALTQQSPGRWDRAPWAGEREPTTVESFRAEPALVGAYVFDGANHGSPYHDARYRPRSWRAGAAYAAGDGSRVTVVADGGYAGFDYLFGLTHHDAANPVDLLLTRPACVGVVWVADGDGAAHAPTPLPGWMAGLDRGADVALRSWTDGEDPASEAVRSAPTWWTTLPAGWHDLGGMTDPGWEMYSLLLAEAVDGACVPSEAPQAPPGVGPAPRAGETCPAWLHDARVATGPDGRVYPAWSPQIDPVWWCYHRHDHGADPRTFHPDYVLPFGYAGRNMRGMPMEEDHVGFKVTVFDAPPEADGAGGKSFRWLISHHFGTHSVGGVCNPFHEVVVAVLDPAVLDAGGSLEHALLANVRQMADFGPGVHNGGANPALVPESCAAQSEDAEARGVPSGVARKFPLAGKGYEPWVPWFGPDPVIPFAGVGMFNFYEPINACDEVGRPGGPWCDFVPNGGSGTGSFFQGGSFGFDLTNWDGPVGRYCTATTHVDRATPLRHEIVSCGAPGAVPQFVSPALMGKILTTGTNRAEDVRGFGQRWRALTGAQPGPPPAEREDSIPDGGPN